MKSTNLKLFSFAVITWLVAFFVPDKLSFEFAIVACVSTSLFLLSLVVSFIMLLKPEK